MQEYNMHFKNYSRYCSVIKMLKDLDLPTLQHRRNRAKLQMLYKTINQMVAIPDNCQTPIPSFLRHGHFKQLKWNQLPQYLTNSVTYTQFCNIYLVYYYICAL